MHSTRAASDKVDQLRVQGSPVSSNNKTGRHDIAEILPKVVLKHQKINQSNPALYVGIYISLARRKHFQTNMTPLITKGERCRPLQLV